tara:strand:+ start:44 stop:3919 length:3876 start_codon:yes stop_codon:yes gene_type:complete
MGDEVNRLCLIVQCDAFDIESNRRKLHNSTRNETLIDAISNRLLETLKLLRKMDRERYKALFLSLLLSDNNNTDQKNALANLMMAPLKEFIKSHVVVGSGVVKSELVRIKAFDTDIKLSDLGHKQLRWYEWNEETFKEACDAAHDELSIEKWGLRHLLAKSETNNLNAYLKQLDFASYCTLFDELVGEDLIIILISKLNEANWIYTQDANVISVESIKDHRTFFIKDCSPELANVFSKLSKDVVHPSPDNVHHLLVRVAGEVYTDRKTISEFLLQPETQAGIGALSVNERILLKAAIGTTRDISKTVPLFSSSTKILRPLNKLISNTYNNLPIWLSGFVIDKAEEAELNSTNKQELLIEENFLEVLFCDATQFDEIIASISAVEVEEFYDYIFTLGKKLPDENGLDFSKVPWLYTSLGDPRFQLPTLTYWPDSLIKLEASKYQNVKNVLESLSSLKLPVYHALKLKETFSLGSFPVDLFDKLVNEGSFDVIALNDFLDWTSSEVSDKQFINQFEFIQDGEYFSVKHLSGHKYYYSENPSLIAFIDEYDGEKVFKLFPKELFGEKRASIGLLHDDQLLFELIENQIGGNELVHHLTLNSNLKIRKAFLASLEKLEFSTDNSFNIEDTVYQIISIAAGTFSKDEKELINSFRSKLIVDGKDLVSHAISSDIIFFPEKTKLGVTLEQVLPKYGNTTFSVDKINDCFNGLSCLFLFKQEHRATKKIYNELLELDVDYYNSEQTLFLNVYGQKNGLNDYWGEKPTLFLDSAPQEDKEEAWTTFLDLSYRQFQESNFLPDKFLFSELLFEEINLSSKHALPQESPPSWIKSWLKDNEEKELENRKDFIINLGSVGEGNAVNELRKALKNQEVFINFKWVEIQNSKLYANTINWLCEIQESVSKSITREKLTPIYDYAIKLNLKNEQLSLPLRTEIEKEIYELKTIQPDKPIYRINESWKSEYNDVLLKHISDNQGVIIDDLCTDELLPDRDVINEKIIEKIDIEKISDRIPFSSPLYTEWSLKNELKISVYKNEFIPYQILLGEQFLDSREHGKAVKHNDELIICQSATRDFPQSVAEHLIPEHFKSLVTLKRQLDKKEEEIHFSDEQINRLNELFNNELPEDYQKNWNLMALVSALENLPSEGFSVAQARGELNNTHEYAQISPVFEVNSDIEYTIMARSAKKGLLYLTQQAWDRLDNDEIKLFVDYKGSDYKLFETKQNILDANDKSTDFQIIRVETDTNAVNIDSILNGSFDKSKIMIIFRVNENDGYDDLFYKQYEPDNDNFDPDNIGPQPDD